MSPFADALAAIAREDATFAALLTRLYESRYTGTLVLHVAHGVPRSVDFPARQVRFTSEPLDTPRILSHS